MAIIAVKGVATGGQLLAALALGAAGVQIGTRFNATLECTIFPASFKSKMVAAGARDTIVIGKPFKASSRVIRNKDAEAVQAIEHEKGNALKFADVGSYIKFDRLRDGIARADPELGVWNCGQSVALIDDVPSCRELIARLVREAEDTLSSTVKPMFQQNVSKL